jgi:hypothetical protein
MKVSIRKHFDYLTPFEEASNADELATIMRLKYPKACSNLEIDAGFFARMVEDVQKYEAWRVIGFDSFEEFCREKLGRTIDDVDQIVSGVKLLQSTGRSEAITERAAKEASKSELARRMKAESPDKTNAEIARELDCDRSHVTHALKKIVIAQKPSTPKPPMIRLTKDPSRTAANIRAKMGDEYCKKLAKELLP